MSEFRLYLNLIRRSPIYLIGLILVSSFVVIGLLAPYILTKPADAWGLTYNISRRFQPPSPEYLFGTDEYGRDVFNRVLLGTRFSLMIGVGVVALSLAIGIPVGLVAGYLGGKAGTALMRITDMFLAFPPLLLAIALAATFGRGLLNTVLALSLSWWPWYSRLAYIQVNSVKSLPYVDAAKVVGVGELRIMFRHVLPNSLTPIITQATLDIGSAILEASALSFLGVGVPPPTPEWGLLVSSGWRTISRAWWISLFPGLSIVITVLGFNLLGDAIKELMDPRLRNLLSMRRV
ncbi:MAG: ABC transporter permease [Zestosphaera sp.]